MIGVNDVYRGKKPLFRQFHMAMKRETNCQPCSLKWPPHTRPATYFFSQKKQISYMFFTNVIPLNLQNTGYFLFPVFIYWLLLLRLKCLGKYIVHFCRNSCAWFLKLSLTGTNFTVGETTIYTTSIRRYLVRIFNQYFQFCNLGECKKKASAFWGKMLGNVSLSVLQESTHFYEVTSIFPANWKTWVMLRTHLFRDV